MVIEDGGGWVGIEHYFQKCLMKSLVNILDYQHTKVDNLCSTLYFTSSLLIFFSLF